jgi:hypothetical protein
MTGVELLAKHGIKLPSTAPGRRYTTCPQCSGKRSKAHQGNKVLGVTIEADGSAHWGCNHCGWTGPEKGNGSARKSNGRIDLPTYVYRDADGAVRFRKVRNLPGREPRFFIQHPDGNGGWAKGSGGADSKIIYRADEVAKAIARGQIIAVVEGEKDADSVAALGIVATCNAHGASEPGKKPKWTSAHSEQLKNADIVVFNDNDAAGYAHADTTCKLSVGVAKCVRRLDLKPHWPDIPKGGDVSDWLAQGHTREELDALIEGAFEYVPQGEAKGTQQEAAQTEAPANGDDDNAELEKLARMSLLDYARAHKDAAKRLGISRLSLLDALVKAKRAELDLGGGGGNDKLQGRAISYPEPEPWLEPVNGAALLDAIAKAIRNHVVLSDAARDAAALWVLHTYLVNCFFISPRAGVCSPVKGCAKSLLLDVFTHLVRRPQLTANVTPSAVFRVIEAHQPTLLIDEADTFLNDNDGLRGVLNGNRKSSQVLRTVGDQHEVRAFATYSACAIALIGKLPDTLHDRAIQIDLKRRLRSEKIEPYRPDRAGHLDVLARKEARWTADNAERVAATEPEMPEGIINREADNWRPLLAIADVAEGDWPERARNAARAAHITAVDDDASLLELLLGDIRDAFKTDKATKARDMYGVEQIEITSSDLVKVLVALEGRPWAELGKDRKPLTQNRLARMLKELKPPIGPQKIGPGKVRVSGYVRAHFEEAFERYSPPEGVSQPDNRTESHEMGTSGISQPDALGAECPVAKSQKPNNDGLPFGCPVAKGGNGQNAHTGTESGLSPSRIRELVEWYEDQGHQRYCDGNLNTAELDAELRLIIREEVAFPEHVEIEFERIMQLVFAV